MNIKKTMGHRTLKGAVCDRPLFLGCSRIKTLNKDHSLKWVVLILDIKNMKSKEVVKILQKLGFIIKRQSGTHVIMGNNRKLVVVPIHKETIPIGTLKSIEKQADIKFRDLNL